MCTRCELDISSHVLHSSNTIMNHADDSWTNQRLLMSNDESDFLEDIFLEHAL